MRKHEAVNAGRRSKLSLSLLAASSGCLIGNAASAQDSPPEEITVTGSRVRQVTGMATPTPVTAMTIEELTNVNPGSTMAEQLDELIRAPVGRLSENSTTTAAGTTQDYVGSGAPAAGGILGGPPKISGLVTANYDFGPWGLMLQGTYYHKVMNNITWVEGRDIDDNWIPSQTTFNFAATYRGDLAGGRQWRAALNVTNLLDREPPIVATATGQTVIIGHDVLGRRYQLSVTVDF